jgi:hypothetical protein
MDVKKAEALITERIARKLCVQCAEPLNRDRHEVWWCATCRAQGRCIICGTLVDGGYSRCREHRPRVAEFVL